jgi:tetratricopeptide (TPR) repeat protein
MNLGAHFVLENDRDVGLEYMRKALQLNPDDGEIRFNFAATLAAKGEHAQAVEEFEEAEKMGVKQATPIIEQLKSILEKCEEGNVNKET